jgi:hypothetical protein
MIFLTTGNIQGASVAVDEKGVEQDNSACLFVQMIIRFRRGRALILRAV